MEYFLAGADDLIVSKVCAHLDVLSLRAAAQTLRPFRRLASLELPHWVVRRLGDDRYPAEDTKRMLLLLQIVDEGALAERTAPLVELLLQPWLSVWACRHLPAFAPTRCSAGCPF
jgi:hypothetical protein